MMGVNLRTADRKTGSPADSGHVFARVLGRIAGVVLPCAAVFMGVAAAGFAGDTTGELAKTLSMFAAGGLAVLLCLGVWLFGDSAAFDAFMDGIGTEGGDDGDSGD